MVRLVNTFINQLDDRRESTLVGVFVDVKCFSLFSFHMLFFHEGAFVSFLCLPYVYALEDSISSLPIASLEANK